MAIPSAIRPSPTPSKTDRRIYCGMSHGTLGELYQGPFQQDLELQISIVSLPVEKFSWCYFVEEEIARPDDRTALSGRDKCVRAIELFHDHYGTIQKAGRWEFFSELEVGKGMASSTADIVAALRCLFHMYGIAYDQRVVIGILDQIERADSVFLDEFAFYLSGQHKVVRRLGNDVGFHTCYAVEDGSVDTNEIGDQLLTYYRKKADRYQECSNALTHAFSTGDIPSIARCSTLSATLSQDVVPKSSFDRVVENQANFNADGIFVAHTGTIIGYLFSRRLDRTTMDELSAFFWDIGRQCRFAKGGWGNV